MNNSVVSVEKVYNKENANRETRNSFVEAAEFEALIEEKLFEPLLAVSFTDDELRELVFTEATKFAHSDDKSIPISEYMKAIVDRKKDEVVTRIRAVDAAKRLPEREIILVTDADAFWTPEFVERQPRGQIKIFAEPNDGLIYVSPVLVRATFLGCLSDGNQGLFQEVRNAVRGLDSERRLGRSVAQSDIRAGLANVSGAIDRYDACIGNALEFVIAHEIGHIALNTDD